MGCGIEYFEMYDQALNEELFMEFLKTLASKNKRQKLVIFMDNLQVHKTDAVQALMQELKMEWIWNVPYSPDFQSIESVFLQVKRLFKQDKLRSLLAEKPFDQKAAIVRSFHSIDASYVDRCIARCLRLIADPKSLDIGQE